MIYILTRFDLYFLNRLKNMCRVMNIFIEILGCFGVIIIFKNSKI
jgi:hypothetical protein